MKKVTLVLMALTVSIYMYSQCTPWSGNGPWNGQGRIAISSDGNEHDHDDWAATPFSLALLAAKGLQDQLVLYTYSDHIWGSNAQHPPNSNHTQIGAKEEMNVSALEGKNQFGFDNTNFIEAVSNKQAAYNAMAAAIDASSASDPLFILGAGPMHVIRMGLERSNANKHQYVTIISHSTWNENHAKNDHGGMSWPNMKSTFSNANFVDILDQNGGTGYDGMRALITKFSWIQTSSARNNPLYQAGSWDWLYERQETCIKKNGTEFDPSDAGMVIYLLTGEEQTNPSDAKNIMESPVAPCGGGVTEAPIPGKIEAEDYSAQSGIQTESTSDVGGGLNVGWTNTGDWMDYVVDVASAGTYTVDFRVASNVNNIKFDLKKGSSVLTTVNSATTGGWQTWKTVSKTVTLSAGVQTLRIEVTGNGWNINWMEFTATSGGDTEAPTVPSGVSSSNITQTSVDISWNASSDNVGVTGYKVYEGTTVVKNVSGTSTTITGLTCETSHTYTVAAYDAAGNESAKSAGVSITTSACSQGGINDITDLAAVATACDQVVLTWTDNSTGESGFRVRRKISGAATFSTLGDVAANVETYTDNSVSAEVTYIYQVRPLDNGSAAGISNNPEVTTPQCGGGNVPFGDLTQLSATVVSCNTVELTWENMDADKFIVRRKKPSDASYTNLATINAPANSYTDNSAAASTTYIYMVRPQQGSTKKLSNLPQVTTPSCALSAKGEMTGSVNVYPNPASEVIVVEFASSEKAQVNIVDLSGKVLQTNNVYTGETISIESLSIGSYVIMVTSENGTTVNRLMVK